MAATLVLLTALIYTADAYSLFGSRVAPSLAQKKYFLSEFERISKPTIVCRNKPEGVVLGTSRAAVGLRPASLSEIFGPTYNFALNGAYLLEVNAALRVAVNCGAKKVLYGIDFFTFTENTQDQAGLVYLMGGALTWEKTAVLARNIFSLSAAVDSLRTIFGNLRDEAPSHDETGFFVNYDPVNVPFRPPKPEARRIFPGAYETFETMLEFSVGSGIEMNMFVSPIYGSHLRDDPVYSTWLARVKAIAARHGVSLRDLARNPSFAEQRDDYFDVSHYKPEVGDRIIQDIFALKPDGA